MRDLQEHGAEVLVLEPRYTSEELMQARADCRGETGSTPNKAEAKAAPSVPSSKPDLVSGASTNTAVPAAAQVDIASTPSGADIEIDGKFVGNTPSSLSVTQGEHTLRLTKKGYSAWEREVTTTAGNVRISPELEPLAPTPAK